MLTIFKKAATFEQSMRLMFGLLMVASGIVVGALALGLVIYFTVAATKFPADRLTILYILAGALGGYLVMQSAVIIAMSLGGPVGRFKLSATKEGATLEASDDNEPVRRRNHHDGSGADNDE